MRTLAPSVRHTGIQDSVAELVLDFEDAWRQGPPLIERYHARLDPEESAFGLAELVKVDLQQRYRRGERPSAREYFGRYPDLAGEDGHALSLIYEEYCLRAEMDGAIDSAEFCERYPTWRDSLVSQLAYHRELSRAADTSTAGPDFPEEGDHFAEYELVQLLGQGGAARVFLAHASNLGGKQVVLKVSRDRGDESAVLGKLHHDNIVAVNATVIDPKTGLRGLCMPYRPGLPLDDVIKRFRRDAIPRSASALVDVVDRALSGRPAEEGRRHGWADFPANQSYADGIAWIGMKLAQALAHAHSNGIYHRDVKPENVLLTRRDGPQLLDFNLAHDVSLADQARAAHRGGTLPYMAREQLLAFQDPSLWKEVGAPADIFSLGLILREMLTLKPIERPADHLKLARAINDLIQKRSAPRTPIRRINRQVPHALEAIIAKSLAESTSNRYATAEELASDLGLYLDRRPLAVAENPSLIERGANRLRRRSRISAVVLSIVFLGWIITSLGFGRGRVEIFELETGRAKALVNAGRFDDAVDAYQRALALNPLSVLAYHGRATAELAGGRLDAALTSIDRALALFRDDGSIDSLREFVRMRVDRTRVLLQIGDTAKDNAQYQASHEFFVQAIDNLDAIRSRPNSGQDARASFSLNYFSALVKISMADIALCTRDSRLAVDSLRVASEHLRAARVNVLLPKEIEEIDGVQVKIRERLDCIAP